jgi:dimethylaniline monooxygenase (N-oxide forming)
MTGFSDVPLTIPSDAPTYWDTFEAKYVTRYLEEYVDSHIYDRKSLRSRIKFGHRAETVEKVDETWSVCVKKSNGTKSTFRSLKLVVAIGHTSIPNMPLLPNEKDFTGHILHHKDFGQASRSVLTEPGCRRITVLGGGKSAADMVYQSVKKGKVVNWVIRKSGEGPALLFPAPGHGRYKNSLESSATRHKACFSPSSFMPWLPSLPHQTSYGVNYMKKRVEDVDRHCREIVGYETREDALPSFKDLDFTTSYVFPIFEHFFLKSADALRAFWCTGPLGLAQHDDFWDTIAKHVAVHRKDIMSMTPQGIVLDNGIEIPTNVLLCGTGWKSSYPFFTSHLSQTLGLPQQHQAETKTWEALLSTADQQVLAGFPQLAHPPAHLRTTTPTTTSKLYRGIAPLEDLSIVFLGHIDISNSFRAAEAQAIWSTAYFDSKVTMPSLEQAQQDVAYMNAFSKRRYPTHGQKGDCFFFELVWYTDALMDDVGLRSHRRKGWWGDWVEPCLAEDFKDVVEEYKRKYGF